MKCEKCGFDNQQDARFCEECASPLGKPRFCRYCGAPVSPVTDCCTRCGINRFTGKKEPASLPPSDATIGTGRIDGGPAASAVTQPAFPIGPMPRRILPESPAVPPRLPYGGNGPAVPPGSDSPSMEPGRIAAGMLTTVLTGILLLTKWIHVPVMGLFGSRNTACSVFQLAKLAGNLSDFAGSWGGSSSELDTLVAALYAAALFAAVAIGLLGLSAVLLAMKNRAAKKCAVVGFVLSMVLTVAVLAGVVAANNGIREGVGELSSFIGDAMELTFGFYLCLSISACMLAFGTRLIFGNSPADDSPPLPAWQSGYGVDRPIPASLTPQAPGAYPLPRRCPHCNAILRPDAMFCGACGKRV